MSAFADIARTIIKLKHETQSLRTELTFRKLMHAIASDF